MKKNILILLQYIKVSKKKHLVTTVFNIVLVTVLCSCASSLPNGVTQTIKMERTQADAALDDYTSNYHSIQLKSAGEESIVSGISKILFCDSNIVVLDSRGNKLLLFDSKGNFIKSTASIIGHAKNEYVTIGDVALDETDKRIYMSSDVPQRMFVFDYDLNLVSTYDMPYFAFEVAVDSAYLYYLYLNDEQTKYEVRAQKKDDVSGTPVTLLSNDHGCPGLFTPGRSLNNNGVCTVALPFDNHVYILGGGKICKEYDIGFGSSWFSKSDNLGATDFVRANKDNIWSLNNICMSDSLMFFSTNKSQAFIAFQNDGLGYIYTSLFCKKIPFITSRTIPIQGKPGAVTFQISPYSLKSYVEAVRNGEYKGDVDPDVLRIAENYNEDDNPLIIIWDLK